jgi:hypothetical protein
MASWRKTKKEAKKAGLAAATMAEDEEAGTRLPDATASNVDNESVQNQETDDAPTEP